MKQRIKIIGDKELVAKVRRLKQGVPEAMENALLTGTMPLEAKWKSNIYDFPLVRTGTYGRSVHREVLERMGQIVQVMVGTNLQEPPYPFFLEFGTRHMAAKPTARPALDDTLDQVRRDTESAWKMLIDRLVR